MTPSVCKYGYPLSQLDDILGERSTEFSTWMVGQTATICDGRSYNHDKGQYEDTGCGPHGLVVYAWDLQRFLDGRPVID